MKTLPAVFLILSSALAQIKTVSIEQLQLPKTETWSHPVFSPSGREIFVTNAEYNGIWEYSLETKLLKVITRDRRSGYNFSISPDGKKIAYRRTLLEGDHRTRVQESVELDLGSSSETSLQRGNSVSTPVYADRQILTIEKLNTKGTSNVHSSTPHIVGIEDTKIILVLNGEKKIFDPLNGQYIWPALSPLKDKIVAVEMDNGAFICTLDGIGLIKLGKINAPQWEKSGEWIIGMDDRDDGHSVVSSDIIAKSIDGATTVNLTSSITEIAMYPSCSSMENKIVFNTYDGKVFVLTYEEVK